MSNSSPLPPAATIHFRPLAGAAITTTEQKLRAALTDELHASLEREAAWRREYVSETKRQDVRLHEYEHRIFNGLQMVVSMLLLQSMRATPEMAVELRIAAGRVTALRSVHQRLHSINGLQKVNFRQYLQHLCEGISGLLFERQAGHTIEVQCGNLPLPATLAGPLGLIVNGLATNAAKYAKGNITIRIEETTSPFNHLLSVLDDGPGLPVDFDPAASKGLGMKIVLSLVEEIGGNFISSPAVMAAGRALRSHSGRPRVPEPPVRTNSSESVVAAKSMMACFFRTVSIGAVQRFSAARAQTMIEAIDA